MRNLVLIVLLIAGGNALADGNDRYPFADRYQQQQFYQLLKELRCLVCQNQDLLDSNSPFAEDLRDEVYAMLNADYNEQEVLRFLTDRYGDFILFQPPLKNTTYFLWFAPFIFLGLGILLLLYGICRRNKLLGTREV